jgi:GNAT superfamily N-acetyltransferase
MFTTPDLAARIDRAEGHLCAGIARGVAAQAPAEGSEVIEIGGGVAVFAGAGSPTNKMIGVGFDGLPDAAALDRVERLFASHNAPLQAEVSTLASPELHACLVVRGYQPRGFENVLGHSLNDADLAAPDGIALAEVGDGELLGWMDMMVTAFAAPDTGGVGGDAVPPSGELRRWLTLTMRVPGFELVAARIGGELAGGGSLRFDGGIAQFAGAATLPAFRRRGVQTALLRWRLGRARAAGCDVAVVCTQPASKSQQNVQRGGFQLLYARQLLVKMPNVSR